MHKATEMSFLTSQMYKEPALSLSLCWWLNSFLLCLAGIATSDIPFQAPLYGKGALLTFYDPCHSGLIDQSFLLSAVASSQNSAYKAVSKGPVQSSSDDGSSTCAPSLSNFRNIFLSSMELEKYRQRANIFSIS